ncbi:MAG: hypothetical protein EXR39_15925 [Betaproteobacteria bacterium]|nr:hypothetical protein [Betaproteobacteria bacterium]
MYPISPNSYRISALRAPGSACSDRPGLPASLVKRLNAAAVKALNAPAVKTRLEQNGAIVMANSPEQFDTTLKEDFATATKVASELTAKGVKFE